MFVATCVKHENVSSTVGCIHLDCSVVTVTVIATIIIVSKKAATIAAAESSCVSNPTSLKL